MRLFQHDEFASIVTAAVAARSSWVSRVLIVTPQVISHYQMGNEPTGVESRCRTTPRKLRPTPLLSSPYGFA